MVKMEIMRLKRSRTLARPEAQPGAKLRICSHHHKALSHGGSREQTQSFGKIGTYSSVPVRCLWRYSFSSWCPCPEVLGAMRRNSRRPRTLRNRPWKIPPVQLKKVFSRLLTHRGHHHRPSMRDF